MTNITQVCCELERARTPASPGEGRVTYFDAEVVGKEAESAWGVPLVQVKLRLSNQNDEELVACTAEVELPV